MILIYKNYLKRPIDVLVAVIALLVLSPLMLLLAVAIFLEDRGPVLFISERVGQGGRSFRFYKFRSMPVNSKSLPSSQAASLQVTTIGKLIRRTNIDELPQLLNILKGDMAMVGPRPPLPTQLELISLRQRSGAINCRPGLTGLAQVSSYDGMSVAEKARFDEIYVKSITVFGDFHIVLRTFVYLLKSPPVY